MRELFGGWIECQKQTTYQTQLVNEERFRQVQTAAFSYRQLNNGLDVCHPIQSGIPVFSKDGDKQTCSSAIDWANRLQYLRSEHSDD